MPFFLPLHCTCCLPNANHPSYALKLISEPNLPTRVIFPRQARSDAPPLSRNAHEVTGLWIFINYWTARSPEGLYIRGSTRKDRCGLQNSSDRMALDLEPDATSTVYEFRNAPSSAWWRKELD